MQQAHVFISGLVQGVSFRYFIKTNAKQLGLTGWVRNTEDGGVEAVFCGEKKKIEEMITLCRQGPFLADVKHLGFEWEEAEDFIDFQIQEKKIYE
jgi:acylphosphatase